MFSEAELKTQPRVESSAGDAGTLTDTKTFTQADMEQAKRDGRNAALGEIGKLQKESATALKKAQEAEGRITQMLKEQDARELEEARDDPVRLTALQERQKRRAAESELVETRQELNLKNERLGQLETERAEASRERIVQEVAVRFGVDVARLAKLAKFTDGSVETIEDLAKDLPKGNEKPPLKPDSNRALGGSISWEQIRADYIRDPRNPTFKARYLEMRAERGRT